MYARVRGIQQERMDTQLRTQHDRVDGGGGGVGSGGGGGGVHDGSKDGLDKNMTEVHYVSSFFNKPYYSVE